jgi:hypothetical protein
MMGDPKEAGAEASPSGAAARGGLSLLSQADSEEPSAQVRGGGGGARPAGAWGVCGPGRGTWGFWNFLPRLLSTSSTE